MNENGNGSKIDLLSAYVDGELNKEELHQTNQILASSFEARKELEKLLQTKSLLQTVSAVKAPVDLLDALEAQAKEQISARHLSHEEKHWNKIWVWTGAWAAAASLLLAVWMGNTRGMNDSIPLEVLLEAHARVYTDSPLHPHILGASTFSKGHGNAQT